MPISDNVIRMGLTQKWRDKDAIDYIKLNDLKQVDYVKDNKVRIYMSDDNRLNFIVGKL